jgi:hypothetical protein
MPNECKNAVVILMSKKGHKKDPKNYRGISTVNTSYQTYSKILNIELQRQSEQFMTETQTVF